MSRKRRLELLADSLRVTGLLAVLLALGTAAVWRFSGDRVDAFEAGVTSWLLAPVERQAATARNESNPARRAELFEALLARLARTGPDDRRADTVRECYTMLSGLAEAGGDLPRATDWMHARHEFDASDLAAAVAYGELLCKNPATASDGLTHLRELASRFPANPTVVTACLRELSARDLPKQMAALLGTARRQPQSQLWTICCGEQRADVVPVRTGGVLEIACTVAAWRGPARVLAPARRDFRGLRLSATARMDGEDIETFATATATTAEGRSVFELELPDAELVDLRLAIADEPCLSADIAAHANDPRIVRLLRELHLEHVQGRLDGDRTALLAALLDWRLAALRAAVRLSCEDARGEILGTSDFDLRLSPSTHPELATTWKLDCHPPPDTRGIRLELPPDAGFRVLGAVDWHRDGGERGMLQVEDAPVVTVRLPEGAPIRLAGFHGALL